MEDNRDALAALEQQFATASERGDTAQMQGLAQMIAAVHSGEEPGVLDKFRDFIKPANLVQAFRDSSIPGGAALAHPTTVFAALARPSGSSATTQPVPAPVATTQVAPPAPLPPAPEISGPGALSAALSRVGNVSAGRATYTPAALPAATDFTQILAERRGLQRQEAPAVNEADALRSILAQRTDPTLSADERKEMMWNQVGTLGRSIAGAAAKGRGNILEGVSGGLDASLKGFTTEEARKKLEKVAKQERTMQDQIAVLGAQGRDTTRLQQRYDQAHSDNLSKLQTELDITKTQADQAIKIATMAEGQAKTGADVSIANTRGHTEAAIANQRMALARMQVKGDDKKAQDKRAMLEYVSKYWDRLPAMQRRALLTSVDVNIDLLDPTAAELRKARVTTNTEYAKAQGGQLTPAETLAKITETYAPALPPGARIIAAGD